MFLGFDGAGTSRRLHRAAQFLANTTSAEFLASVFSRPSGLQRALAFVKQLDHVGFVAPAQALEHLSWAASTAGFNSGQQTFASTILARELGQCAGRHLVPTTIFKARGACTPSETMGVEVAMPRAIDAEVVRGWIREGIGTHVAFRIASPSHFGRLGRLMDEEGFRMPTFMNAGPLRNPREGLTAVYFDRGLEPDLRLEFYHYE